MKLKSILFLLIFSSAGSVYAQKIISRLAFGNQDYDYFQLISRNYYHPDGSTVGPFIQKYPIQGRNSNTALVYTPFGRDETISMIIGQKDWLDLTNSVAVSGTGIANPRIVRKGVDGRGTSSQMSWVEVEFTLRANATPGIRTVRLIRPSLTGTDENTFRINLLQNYRIMFVSPFTLRGTPTTSKQAVASGDEIRFEFQGQRLNLVRGIRNNGNNLAGSVIRNLRIVERSASKLVFACNLVGEGKLTFQNFASNHLDVEPGASLFNLNCKGSSECILLNTIIEPASSTGFNPRGILIVQATDAERGIR